MRPAQGWCAVGGVLAVCVAVWLPTEAGVLVAPSASARWTWIRGSVISNRYAIYGTRGVPGPINRPGVRTYAAGWVDAQGRFWLFGGEGHGNRSTPDDNGNNFNDLWRFDPRSDQWAWISGSPVRGSLGHYGIRGVGNPANQPRARYKATTWTDVHGRFWLFGGVQSLRRMPMNYHAERYLNDLWCFDPKTRLWTWISGSRTANHHGVYGTRGISTSGNHPGGRMGAIAWTDAQGRFWIFGGYGYGARASTATLNDLWRFDSKTRRWVWIAGSVHGDQPSVYGARGILAPGNHPGARSNATAWRDVHGRFWLYGGQRTQDFPSHYYSDLWRFDPKRRLWTWMGGPRKADHSPVYGVQGIPRPVNNPGGRKGAITWIDARGGLWLFGGRSFEVIDNGHPVFNDLWHLSSRAHEWVWVGGRRTPNQPAVYATSGIPSATNFPGARCCATGWIDAEGRLWMYGGDLWRYR